MRLGMAWAIDVDEIATYSDAVLPKYFGHC
jgi:hypothetical protein